MLVVISELLLLLKTLGVISGSLLSISVNTKLRSIVLLDASSLTVISSIKFATVGPSSTGLTVTTMVSSTVKPFEVAR